MDRQCTGARGCRGVGLIPLLGVLAACAPQSTADLAPETQERRITNGALDADPAHAGIVVVTFRGGGTCSGTLVSRRVVLTAAHCLVNRAAADVRVGFGLDARTALWYVVAETLIHPGYDPATMSADLALARLDEPAPDTIEPIPNLPGSLAIASGEEGSTQLTFCGYGRTETGALGMRYTVTDTIGKVCLTEGGCDYRTGKAANPTVCVDEQPGGPCIGDSGGPALVTREGRQYVAGVISYGDEACADFSCSTKVDAYESFIAAFVALEQPQGAACTTPLRCASARCVHGVCCESACDTGPCFACSRASGGLEDGRCTPTTASCDDADPCTVQDRCSAGTCAGLPMDCRAPDDCQLDSVCDPATASCTPHDLEPDGLACDDRSACTTGETCAHGWCGGGALKSCPEPGACQEALGCDPATGECVRGPRPDGTACPEGTCEGGVCTQPCGCGSGRASLLPIVGIALGVLRRRR